LCSTKSLGSPAAQSLPLGRGLLRFFLLPQQLFTGFRHHCLGLGGGVVVVAWIDGQENLAGLEEPARGEGRMNPDHFAGNLCDEIDFGARGDYPLGMDVEPPHGLKAGGFRTRITRHGATLPRGSFRARQEVC
jgi:hypothetical protein